MLPCLEITADLIYGSTKAINKTKQSLLSDATVGRQ